MKAGHYFRNVVTWLDEGVNVIVFAGNCHETISDRAALARSKGKRWGCVLCRVLGWINPGHCDRALQVIEVPLVKEFTDL